VQYLIAVPIPNGLIICATSQAAESSAMATQRRHSRSTEKYPPGGPAEWLADGHVTCNIQCSGGNCDRRMVDVRLATLPHGLRWSTIVRRLVCKECGTAGSVNIVPNWHDRPATPYHSPGVGKRETLPQLHRISNLNFLFRLSLEFYRLVSSSVARGAQYPNDQRLIRGVGSSQPRRNQAMEPVTNRQLR
jgi:hypothetical protein